MLKCRWTRTRTVPVSSTGGCGRLSVAIVERSVVDHVLFNPLPADGRVGQANRKDCFAGGLQLVSDLLRKIPALWCGLKSDDVIRLECARQHTRCGGSLLPTRERGAMWVLWTRLLEDCGTPYPSSVSSSCRNAGIVHSGVFVF